jgi:hypothetical protein
MFQAYARSSFSSRSNRALAKSTATVWANIIEYILHAMATERTFIGANMGLRRRRRQIFVAMLAVWS